MKHQEKPQCDHPANKELELGLGIFCGVCKQRLRLLSPTMGNKKIAKALAHDVGFTVSTPVKPK